MPKVLRILNRLNIGGPTYNVAYLSKYINPKFETKVIAGIKDPHEGSSEYILKNLDLPFEYISDMYRSINPAKDKKAFSHIKHIVKTYKPDIIHTHAAKAGVLGRLAGHYSNQRPRAIIHTYHGNVFDGYFSPLKTKIFLGIERHLCTISNAIVAISDQQKHDLVNKYAIAPAHKVHVIKLGFDLDKFDQDTDIKRKSFRKFYNIADDELVICITGRLTAIKNHSLFIESLKIFKDENPDVKFKAFVVGDGELLEPIMHQTSQCGLTFCKPTEDNYNTDIIYTSWRKDIDVINAGADIIALTSINEGTPVSIIEAMASTKAVVCTNVGGVKDVVKDGYSGLLSDQTPQTFAAKIKELAHNKDLRNHMAAEGKKFAFRNYSYRRLVTETEELYNYLLQ